MNRGSVRASLPRARPSVLFFCHPLLGSGRVSQKYQITLRGEAMAVGNFKDFLLGALLTAVLVLTGQSWDQARVSWEHDGLDARGVPEAPVRAEYAVVVDGDAPSEAVATFDVDLSNPGAPIEGGEYRADLLDFSDIPPGSYSVYTRLYDSAGNASLWGRSNLATISPPPPPPVLLPQQVEISGENGDVRLSGVLTLTRVTQ